MTRIIAISGKPGAEKMVIAFRIIRELRVRGYSADMVRFAEPLYGELNSIHSRVVSGVNHDDIIDEYNLGENGYVLLELLSDVGEVHPDYGLDRRHENVRQALGVLGSDIRREQDPDYFIDRLDSHGLDFGVSIDIRYPNEADWVRDGGGIVLRAGRSHDDTSGGYKYQDGLASPVESALDNYLFFSDYVYSDTFNGVEYGEALEQQLGLDRNHG